MAERQAGAEVEITPEMIESGGSVLCEMELAFADEDFWAEKVYRAMAAVSPSSASYRRVRENSS